MSAPCRAATLALLVALPAAVAPASAASPPSTRSSSTPSPTPPSLAAPSAAPSSAPSAAPSSAPSASDDADAAAAGASSSAARPAVSPARHRRALLANRDGLRFYRAGQLPRAALHFRDAIALDPSYALAHYNLACVASRLRDVTTAVAELRWLAASPDPVARARVEKSRVDPDLDFASALPAVRALLALPPYDPAQPRAWLAERDGVWSAELPTADCALRSYRITFAADGTLELTVAEACAARAAHARSFDGHARSDADGVTLSVDDWSQWPAGVRVTLVPCPGLPDAPGACFVLTSDGHELGPFHRGAPGTSPMRAHVAAAR